MEIMTQSQGIGRMFGRTEVLVGIAVALQILAAALPEMAEGFNEAKNLVLSLAVGTLAQRVSAVKR